jgi:hypothetical protein
LSPTSRCPPEVTFVKISRKHGTSIAQTTHTAYRKKPSPIKNIHQPSPIMKKTLTIIGLAILAASSAEATLLTWDMQGVSSPTTFTANTTAANLLTTGSLNTLQRTGLGNPGGANSFNSNSWNTTGTFVESDDYISFTVQPSSAGPGYEMTLTSLQYVVNGSNTAPNTGRWGYRIGTGAFTLQPTFTMTFSTPGSLATWDFTDFTTTSQVEFRFWVFGTTSINGGSSAAAGSARISNIAGNDLVLNGSVTAIPEPSSAMLLGLGALGAFALAHRARRK